MRVNITRAQHVREYAHWIGVEVPNEVAREVIDGGLSDEEIGDLLAPYLKGEPTNVNIGEADEPDTWFDVEPWKEQS